MKKRSLSLLLALIMVLSLVLPGASAFADTTATQTPVEGCSLKWAARIGSGWTNSPSPVTIYGDNLVVAVGTKIELLSREDGSVVKAGDMGLRQSYSIVPVTVDGDTIVVPQSRGTVEAFDGTTLESKWIYSDPLKGQGNSRVLCADGKAYVGFWKNEDADANFVCIDMTTGKADWSYTVTGGFYFAGATEVGNYIVVGTDDGAKVSVNGNGSILVFKKTYAEGEEIKPVSSAVLEGSGDVRCNVVYSDGRVYVVTKGGYLCSAAISSETGELSDVKAVSFGAQSTSTPTIYGNYIIFGTGGGMTAEGTRGNLAIADKNTLQIIKAVPLKGYPQCEQLVSTAYVDSTGYLYVYSTYNAPPGGLTLIKVKADDPTDATVTELYDAKGHEQYCLSPITADKEGNLYYKNDTGCIFCISQIRSEDVFVSLSNKGDVELNRVPVTASDRNSDGIIDVDEVLYATHEKYYEGGAAAGYECEETQYGFALSKLWGDTSGSFGYYVDDKMAMSAGDPVADGGHVYAYIYKDTENWSDKYCYFDKSEVSAYPTVETSVKLMAVSDLDANYEPIFAGYDDAVLTAYSDADLKNKVDSFTHSSGKDGEYGLTFAKSGTYYVTATSEKDVLVPAVCKVTVSSPFTDVYDDMYYYDAVNWAAANGYVNGMTPTTFVPDGECTRAQVVTMLYRRAGSPEVTGECPFTDVYSDIYYHDAVVWAAEKGITKGTSATEFSPDLPCTRAQVVTFLYRYMNGSTRDFGSMFSDITNRNIYYYDSVKWAAENGVVKGFPDGTFKPDLTCTRAQFTTMLYRLTK